MLAIWACFLDDATEQSWFMIADIILQNLSILMAMSIPYLQQRVKKTIVKEANNKTVREAVNVQMKKGAGRLRIQYLVIFGIAISCTLPVSKKMTKCLTFLRHRSCCGDDQFLRARNASLHFGLCRLFLCDV